MKRYMNFIFTGLLLVLCAASFSSCSDDENGGLPEILNVRTTDPSLVDSTFVKTNPGQMIVIEGNNLGSARKVYINNQDVYFNPNYVTDHSIILTIPADLELTGTNPDLPKEIKVENDKGVATFSFHVLSPAPLISGIMIEYPVNTGDEIIINGSNFYEIEKIIMTDQEVNIEDIDQEITGVEVSGYEVSSDYKKITFSLPGGVAKKGNLVIITASGRALVPYATFVLPPTIEMVSSDMPIIGSEFFIVGKNYIQVKSVNINGEFDVSASDLRVSDTRDTIYVTLPNAPTKSGHITVTAAGGDSNNDAITFYPIENVVLNYDGIGYKSWGASEVIVTGDGQKAPFVTTGNAGGFVEKNVGGWNYWMGSIDNGLVYTNAVSDDTPVSDLVLRFECFVAYPMYNITMEVLFGGDWNNKFTGYVPKSIITKNTEVGKWMTCQIPLSSLVVSSITNYGQVKSLGTEQGFLSKNASEVAVPNYEVYFDNLRIVKNK